MWNEEWPEKVSSIGIYEYLLAVIITEGIGGRRTQYILKVRPNISSLRMIIFLNLQAIDHNVTSTCEDAQLIDLTVRFP